MNKTNLITLGLMVGLMALDPVLAGGFEQQPKTIMQSILSIIQTVGVVVATAGLCWGGYKMIFKGANIMDVAGPMIGCVVVGASGYVSNYLLG